MSFKQWAKENQEVVAVLGSLVTLAAIVWAGLRMVFAPPTLAMAVQTSPLRLPWYRYEQVDHALAADSARLSDSARSALQQVRKFLYDTKTFTEIQLTNNSDRSLTNLDLRFRFVRAVDGWAVESDNLDLEEQQHLRDAVRYDPTSGMLALHEIPRLPPKTTLSLFVWGDVSAAAILGNDQLTVTYDGGAGELIREREIRGLDALVYDNAGLLVLALLLLNVGLWGLYVDRMGKRMAAPNAVESEQPVEPSVMT